MTSKSKSITVILALFLGGLGAHHFYLGNAMRGLLYALFCWTLIPAIAALVEAVYYASRSDAQWQSKYGARRYDTQRYRGFPSGTAVTHIGEPFND